MALPRTNRSRFISSTRLAAAPLLALAGALLLGMPACGGDDDTTGGTAGTGGSSGSAGSGTAGKAGSGGTGGSGGVDAGKDSSAGSGGTGGASGAAGKGGAAGTSGAGGSAGKGGGAGTAGAGGKDGGAGTAGAAGTGGSAGSAGTGGTAGSGGTTDAGDAGDASDGALTCNPDAGGGAVPIDAAAPDAGGGPDDHCTQPDGGKIVNSATMCPNPDASAPPDPDAGPDQTTPPHYGTEADDDDCKTHVSFTSTCVAKGVDVMFTVDQKLLSNSMRMTGAKPTIEAFLNTTTPADTTRQTTTENAGVYTVGPIRFNQSGLWTVRYHFFEECADTDDSKHTHVAFYVRVP